MHLGKTQLAAAMTAGAIMITSVVFGLDMTEVIPPELIFSIFYAEFKGLEYLGRWQQRR